MIIISYVTKNTPYISVLNTKLLPSIKKWNLRYDIEYIEDKGDWCKNTNYKSTHIKQMLLKHKEPICFLDSDAIILKHPSLLYNLPQDFDIAFHLLNWYGLWRNQWENTSNMQLLSGTLCFNYNQKTLNFLDQCIKNINDKPHQWEQITIQETLAQKSNMIVEYLPFEYCCVIRQDNSIPNFCKKPIILHTQASRKFKNRRNWDNT